MIEDLKKELGFAFIPYNCGMIFKPKSNYVKFKIITHNEEDKPVKFKVKLPILGEHSTLEGIWAQFEAEVRRLIRGVRHE